MRETIMTALICTLLSAGLALAQGGETQSFVVPLSDPSQPVVLEASVMMGSISVSAYEGSEVQVEVSFEGDPDDDEEGEEREGLTRIPSHSAGVTIEEKNNKIEISTDWSNEEIYIKVKVPVRTSVHLDGLNGELVEIDGVTGQHELSHTNGGIKAVNVRGSVIADTTNGDVVVELLEIDPDTPMSFSSFNGDVEVTLPASTQADLRMKSGQGDIYTDFDVQLQPTQPRVTREQEGEGFRVRMEKEVLGKIGAGGPEFRFKTFNGDIILRKLQ